MEMGVHTLEFGTENLLHRINQHLHNRAARPTGLTSTEAQVDINPAGVLQWMFFYLQRQTHLCEFEPFH